MFTFLSFFCLFVAFTSGLLKHSNVRGRSLLALNSDKATVSNLNVYLTSPDVNTTDVRDIRFFAYLQHKTHREAVKLMNKMIKEVQNYLDCADSADVNGEVTLAVILDETQLGDFEKCFSFGIGPASVDLCVKYSSDTQEISGHIKVVIRGVTILDTNFAKLSIGQQTCLEASVGIASIKVCITFGRDTNLYVEFSIEGSIGIGPFKKHFGPIKKRINLPF